ncbi:MAG: hypothetical protein U9O20_00255 [Patescibacteria group bacterium]|nr:hypothetical protein [Patescibacteria group bacterium]
MYQQINEDKTVRTLRNELRAKESALINIDSDQGKINRQKGEIVVDKKQVQKKSRYLKEEFEVLLEKEAEIEEKQFELDSRRKSTKKEINILQVELLNASKGDDE